MNRRSDPSAAGLNRERMFLLKNNAALVTGKVIRVDGE
jgi:hypothetical protein